MLAVVHHTPDHRQSSSNSSSRPARPHPRKQPSSSFPSSSSSRSASAAPNVASNIPHRHPTVPRPAPQLPSKYHPHPPPDHPTPPLPTSPVSKISPSQFQPGFDIHSYPSSELLPLLASLLTQIAATNDNITAASPFQTEPPSTMPSRTSLSSITDLDAPIWRTLTTASRTAISTPSSTLTFHARNVPTITLEAYLLRILKYCPTTNEVFLSLLVYFDRMSKLSNEATGKAFVIDSYNIHRLVIAGVTVASKFFSDVFYTNSRYAKVGGLPQAELNQLELQFLLLNDFRLVIHTDEMQRYAEQLILFSNSSESPSRSSPVVPSPSHTSTHGGSSVISQRHGQGPSEAMGAIDAYGGRIGSGPGLERYTNGYSHQDYPKHPTPIMTTSNRTPHVRPRGVSPSPSTHSTSTVASYETEPETETETETDGGSTTDDEPTIRPPHSCADSEDDRSLFDGNVGEDTGDEGGGESSGGKGDLTPERKRLGHCRDGNRFSDESMASP